jgi:polyhydroxyalkanoate synthesis regulator phasin
MNIRKILPVIAMLGLLILSVGAVGAQDATAQPQLASGRQPGLIRTVINVVADETGLEPQDILGQLRDGLKLTDIITANGRDVNQVITDSVAKLTDEINQAVSDGKMTQDRADHLLSNLQDVVTRGVNGELFPNALDRGTVRTASRRILVQVVADATGLTTPQVLQQVRAGSTLADIITKNGSDVYAVVDNAVAAATEQINAAVTDGRLGQEQADQLLANLPDLYTAAVNGQVRQNTIQRLFGRGVLALAADQTGMKLTDINQEMRSGKLLADILTEHNVDVNAFIDSAVTQAQGRIDKAVSNGRITQEQADQMLKAFRDRLTERINQAGLPTPEATPTA